MIPNVELSVPLRVSVPIAACVGTVAYLIYKKSKPSLCKDFEDVGYIRKIFIYPIKSLPPIEVSEALVTPDGLSYKKLKDRGYMLLNAESEEFITARQEPTLLLLKTHYDEENVLTITCKDSEMPQLRIDLTDENIGGKQFHTTTWFPDSNYEAFSCDSKICEWFSQYLGKKVYLLQWKKNLSPLQEIPNRFQDNAAISYLSLASMKALDSLLKDENANISYRNFRPSILAETKYPFEEDFWQNVRMGEVETDFWRRCDRCVLTTVDPDTGVKTNKEPLETLRKFRVDRSTLGVSKYKLRPLLSTLHFVTTSGTVRVDQKIQAVRAPRELL